MSLPAFSDNIDEKVMQLSSEIKCVVCEGESIKESRADLAVQMREIMREKFQAGENKEQIKSYLVERYGEGILFNPPVNGSTLLLWASPLLLLIGGLFVLRKMTK